MDAPIDRWRTLIAVALFLGSAAGCRSPIGTAPDDDAAAVSEKGDTARSQAPEVDPQKVCQSSDECVLVNWGCCDDPCWGGGLRFTSAVNQASEAMVYRFGSCGQVCNLPMPCGFTVSPSCDDGVCTVHCSGDCPVSTSTDASVVEAMLGETVFTTDARR